jgi:D-alanyl-D-alanine carboxypeptidase
MYPAPPRRHAPQVYRIRRAIVATFAVVVVFVGWKAVGPGGGDSASPTTTSSSTSTTLPALPKCVDGEVMSTQDPREGWATILMDNRIALPPTFFPPDLTNISQAGFPFTDGVAVRGLVIPDLKALREAAAANGTPIKVIIGYRSYQTQEQLYARRTDELGASEAGSRVARPGHSEHQLGTTVDITSDGMSDVDQSWAATPTGQWIASHAHEYGFVLSYPADASSRTCYDFEPWHLRYVGREEAAAVIAKHVTLREYLWDLSGGTLLPPDATTTTSSTTTTTEAGDAR